MPCAPSIYRFQIAKARMFHQAVVAAGGDRGSSENSQAAEVSALGYNAAASGKFFAQFTASDFA
jgi:hypothetical protein